MKKILFLIALTLGVVAFSQGVDPVTPKVSVEKISDNEYVLVTTALIEKDWAIYSQKQVKKGPVASSFTYVPNKNYKLIGETEEFNGKVVMDKTFGLKIKKFYKKAVFKQKIKLLSKGATIKVDFEYMVCNNQQCLPPSVKELVFSVVAD